MRSVLHRVVAYVCAAIVFGLAAAAGAAGLLPGVASATAGVGPDANFPCNSPNPCVTGTNSGAGPGIKGSGKTGAGVLGTSTSGFAVRGTSGNGASGGVFGLATTGVGVFGRSSFGVGVSGLSTSGFGVEAVSTTSAAVHAVSSGGGTAVDATASSGTAIKANTSGSVAVSANAPNGFGAFIMGSAAILLQSPVGTSTSSIIAQDNNSRVTFFVNGNGNVVSGASSGTGLDASTASGTGAVLHSGNGDGAEIFGTANGAVIIGADGVIARSPAGTSNFPIIATDTSANDVFYVDGAGNVFYHGSLNHFSRTRGGQEATTYGPTTTAPTLEDVGTAQLVNGEAFVRLDSMYAQAIDLRAPYHVFLTPNGDTRGLYVASKNPDGFVVRETQSGHGTLAFDYRVVATALGRAGERISLVRSLPKAPIAMPRTLPMPKAVVAPPAN